MIFQDDTFFYPIESLRNALSSSNVIPFLKKHYGINPELLVERSQKIAGLFEAFCQMFPNERCAGIIRVPGRINLMGVHVDHRGGWCNYLPIARETFFCLSPRSDNRIVARNLSPAYPDSDFSIENELPLSARGRWMDFIESISLERGHWCNYLKAGILKLQDANPSTPLRGMNVVVDGDIPARSGLSSSSTLVVGAMMALCYVNNVTISPFEQIELCGEGEWYVGTRGGCGDHAAMILGRLNRITHTGFKPLSASYCPLPPEVDVIIAQSGIQAAKAAGARETFNSRIASYEVAFAIFKETHPQFRERLQFLRDIAPDRFDTSLADFYHSLKTVPVSASKEELFRFFPTLTDEWNRIFTIYGEPSEALPLRETLLFGVSECDRARRFPALLEKGDAALAGRFMYISHDGDRVTTWKNGQPTPYRSPYDNDYLDTLAANTHRSPTDETLSPAWQPGGYRCSLPELDRLVDCCKTIDGVLGAGLTGAGLGGAILVLVHSEAAQSVIEKLKIIISLSNNGETQSQGEIFVERCRPVSGASLLTL